MRSDDGISSRDSFDVGYHRCASESQISMFMKRKKRFRSCSSCLPFNLKLFNCVLEPRDSSFCSFGFDKCEFRPLSFGFCLCPFGTWGYLI